MWCRTHTYRKVGTGFVTGMATGLLKCLMMESGLRPQMDSSPWEGGDEDVTFYLVLVVCCLHFCPLLSCLAETVLPDHRPALDAVRKRAPIRLSYGYGAAAEIIR